MHIFLFGGTSEGRRIAEVLAELNAEAPTPRVQVEVYVVSSYGASLLPKAPGLQVHVGRLDEAAMTALFSDAARKEAPRANASTAPGDAEKQGTGRDSTKGFRTPLVIDATHPYAVEVSENIVKACAATGVRCIRVEREDAGTETEPKDQAERMKTSGPDTAQQGGSTAPCIEAALQPPEKVHWVNSIEEAVDWMCAEMEGEEPSPDATTMPRRHVLPVPPEAEGGRIPMGAAIAGKSASGILITTGSKELAPYTRIPHFSERCYVRALPTMEALEKCQQLGFRRDHLILMQGPFSEEMNIAQLHYAGACCLVTKASGEAGGFPEKCEAALALGVTVIVIGRTKEVSIPHAPWYDRKKVNELIQALKMEAGHENR